MTGRKRRRTAIGEQWREDARLEPYLSRGEKLARAAAGAPLAAAGLVLLTVRQLAPTLPTAYLVLGMLVWVLAAAVPLAAVTVRQRDRARQRRRAARQASAAEGPGRRRRSSGSVSPNAGER